jgi:hypothetical protein
MPLLALGRDLDGRYSNSPLKPWFDQLKSGYGLCCSDRYRVRVPKSRDSKIMVWVDVSDDSGITEPNRVGRTMVWPLYFEGITGDERPPQILIRCFMPGSMT